MKECWHQDLPVISMQQVKTRVAVPKRYGIKTSKAIDLEHWMILCSLRENGSHKDTTEKECRMYCAVNGGRAPTAGDQAGTSHI
ncbi:hypothetical protein OUZ56_031256 [Daphnia magna]|uniref:Uncharacterized protein n=1 Tax=Daphnia magna TaxID=35525 RepID=A0ABQ9ZTQ8_9CRUS|nr:hypothetical protein OUZ56_031256 [Daphnia magna]